MKTETMQNKNGRWSVIEIDTTGSGKNYYAYCNGSTGRCGGYSLPGVLKMAADYSTRSNAMRAYKNRIA